MSRPWQFASGISVVFTTLAFGHIMLHDTLHLVSNHHESQLFVVVHSIVAAGLAILSLLGAYSLLRSGRKQN